MKPKYTVTLLFLTVIFSGLTTDCKKKVAVATPAPLVQEVAPVAPPEPPAPTAILTAEPTTVGRG